jgi:hypothetical protein
MIFMRNCLVPLLFASLPISAAETDTSGTNPAVLLNTITLFNEYTELPSGDYLDTLSLRVAIPFAEGKMNLRLSAPFIDTDAGGGSESGFGDISLKWNWIPMLDAKNAWLTSMEVFAPTAKTGLGTEQWTLAPGITYARFVNENIIIAPALIHNFSVAGKDGFPDINRTDFDLYMVYTASNKSWWVTSDLTVSVDFQNDNKIPMSWEVQVGRTLCKWNGAAVNAYIKPGIGIGKDRFYDWNVEVGVSLIGF